MFKYDAPMLGLVATMIPMGPALIAVSSGDSIGMAEQLVVAFSAVIVALVVGRFNQFSKWHASVHTTS